MVPARINYAGPDLLYNVASPSKKGAPVSFWADTRDFADWWLEELRTLGLKVVRRARIRAPDLVVRVARAGMRLRRPDGSDFGEQLSSLAEDELRSWIKTAGLARPRIEILLAPDRFLQRRLAPFSLPKRRALAAAGLDLSSTPLDSSAVMFLFGEDEALGEGTRFFIVKKVVLEPLIRTIERAGGIVAAVCLETEQGVVRARRENIGPHLKHARRDRLAGAFRLATLSTCLLGAVLTFSHAQWRLREGARQLDSTVAVLEGEAKVVRTLSDRAKRQLQQMEKARAQKAQAVPVARIWEEMTRLIPDGSWATDLTIKDRKVTFSGFSPSASTLIPLLEASPLFANPTFAGPVSRAPDTSGERFTIEKALES